MVTRLFYSSDVHGSEKTFMKFLGAGKFYQVDVLIMGGDITGKMIQPILKKQDDTHITNFLGTQHQARTEEELQKLESIINNNGYYAYVLAPEEDERIRNNPEEQDKLFSRLMIERVKRWVKKAEDAYKNSEVKIFILPGNDDSFIIDPIIEESDYVVNPEGKVLMIDDQHEMISTGYANITPFGCPRDIPEEEISRKIETMASKVRDMSKCIFNMHCPPFDSGLDICPILDENLKVKSDIAGIQEGPAGSRSVRTAIEKYQPLLGLHGHIHESRGIKEIGRTRCMNPGSEYSEGILRGALVILDKKGIKGYNLIMG